MQILLHNASLYTQEIVISLTIERYIAVKLKENASILHASFLITSETIANSDCDAKCVYYSWQ